MKVLVTGSRNFTNRRYMRRVIDALYGVEEIIQGEAKGADLCAKGIAKEMGIQCIGYPAQWKKYGKSAGPIRNQEMLDKEHPDLVLAFPLEGSVGTWDMVRRAQKAATEVLICEEKVGPNGETWPWRKERGR